MVGDPGAIRDELGGRGCERVRVRVGSTVIHTLAA
jgi:hypothetical protein